MRPIRILLATPGWPSGILDLASWVKRQGLAEPVVCQFQPEDLAPDELRRALGQRGLPCPPGPSLDEALRTAGGKFLARLVELDPHLVGFRIEGGQLEQVRALVRAVRLFSQAEVILGGPTATSHPQEVLIECGADYVFAGEAEETLSLFLTLARRHNSTDLQPEIPGLCFRYGGRTWTNTLPRDGYGRSAADVDRDERSSHAPCPVLDGTRRVPATYLPAPACLRNLVRPVAAQRVIDANRLDWSLLENFTTPFDSLFFTGGRGCPGACSFCSKLHGQEVRTKSARQLLDEITAADARLAEGALRLHRWRLFQYVDDPRLQDREVGWAAVFDEDFFLHRKRSLEFFRLWSESRLSSRYRLSFQTNPCTLLTSQGRVHGELLDWIDRLKPMIQLGAESFHAGLLARWHKRHTVPQLETVLDALDSTGQDYTVFQILTDFDSTPEELLETLRLLISAGYRHPRMRIASSPFTIPLYDSDVRATLEFSGRLGRDRARHFTDYEQPQPGWMDPLAADLADRADAQLQWALDFAHRESALGSVFEILLERIRELRRPASADVATVPYEPARLERLEEQILAALDRLREIRS
jgi:hypothetical protein